MSKSITKAGKTVAAATALALAELGLTEDKVKVEVLEEGSRGLFGIGSKDAVVRVTPSVDLASRAVDFLNDVFFSMGLKVDIDVKCEDRIMKIDLSGDNMGIIIGKRGDTLDALEHLTSLCVNRGDGEYTKVILDTENYREKRHATLVKLANNLARSVVRNHRKVTLEPMSSNERRIIHSTLQANPDIDTYSIGEEPNRRIVIALKKK
jgi:spoIIIJ-associated protein